MDSLSPVFGSAEESDTDYELSWEIVSQYFKSVFLNRGYAEPWGSVGIHQGFRSHPLSSKKFRFFARIQTCWYILVGKW
jgi:hypothetical protein